MASKTYIFKTNDTVLLFRKICNIVYLSCGTNFMFDDLKLPGNFTKIFNHVSKIFEVLAIYLIISYWGAFFTQKNLTLIQKTDLYLFGPTSINLYAMYLNGVYRKEQIKELGFTLAVTLKEMFSDSEFEKNMIKKTWRFVIAMACIVFGSLLTTGMNSGYLALTTNATFTTMPLVWPSLEDHSRSAGVARFLYYIIWWIFIVRVISTYLITLAITVCLAYQYTNLCKYFEGLNSIFEGSSSQDDKERRYEDAFKVGIKMHSITLWCVKHTQTTGSVAFSAQVILNVSVLVLLMMRMMYTERTLMAVMPIFFMAASVLVGSGLFMWNAGDVTFEASKLPTAMFYSGWHNCQRESSVRVRKMVTIAITQAQKPVLIKGLGFIELSYDSYVKIVKSSYSLFSVIY